MSTREGESFFDQLCVESALRPWLGKPWVTVSELCDTNIAHLHAPELQPLSRAELAGYLADKVDGDLKAQVRLTPLATCWPMGSSWASTQPLRKV